MAISPARHLRGARAEVTGRGAKDAAADALIAGGWTVLARRIRTPAGELDLVAEPRRAARLRRSQGAAEPDGGRARARAAATRPGSPPTAECWLAEHPGHGAAGIRFDVLLVAADGTVRRIADAFRLGDA